eukprot:758592-Hanusia_phi.AAC.3
MSDLKLVTWLCQSLDPRHVRGEEALGLRAGEAADGTRMEDGSRGARTGARWRGQLRRWVDVPLTGPCRSSPNAPGH